MVFLKARGKNLNYKNKILILHKLHQGYLKKKLKIKIDNLVLSRNKINLFFYLKKINLLNFILLRKFEISLKNNIKKINIYNNIFLKYFENKPFYIY